MGEGEASDRLAYLPPHPRIPQEFNKGLFDYLIATDDVHGASKHGGGAAASQGGTEAGRGGRGGGRRGGGGGGKDEEFGVTRGIDFKGVRTVINFDMPSSTQG